MQTVYCQNITIGKDGERRTCHRWLAQITDLQVDMLKLDPESRMILRCPQCPSSERFVAVRWDVENGMTFESIGIKPSNFDAVKFDDLKIFDHVS